MALRFDGSIGDWIDDSMVWDPVGLRMIPKEQADAIAALPPNLRAALNNREGGIMDAVSQAKFKQAGINPNLKIYGGNGQVAAPGTTPDGVTADVPFGGYDSGFWGEISNLGQLASYAALAYGLAGAGSSMLGAAGVGGAGAGTAASGGTAAAGAGGGAAAAGGAAEALTTPEWLSSLLAETGEAGVSAGALEGGFNAAAAGGGLAGGAGGGEGMWDWLDSLDPTYDQSFENVLGPSVNSGGFGTPGSDIALTSASDAATPYLSNAPAGSVFAASNAAPAINSFGLGDAINSGGFLSTLTDYGKKFLPKLLGSPDGGAGASGISGPFGSGVLNAAFDASPFLLALYQANQQSDDLNGVLNQINGAGYQKAVLDPYDLETGYGRAQLQQDMGLRGVAGSSFGNQQLNNYQYMRDLGRGDMASKAALASAGLQGNLINTRNTNTNLLLGAGLNASANLFAPKTSPLEDYVKRLMAAGGSV